ncbi:MAG: IS30 family transposase [Candidatus Micrarchaeota archaeon]|nr:IS30 family transposase [Candidatus Micrarchaeota archaeon]
MQESERRRIERLKASGLSLRKIAERLGRSVSTVSDELRRGAVRGVYDARKAGHKAYVRRKYSKVQCLKVVLDDQLRAFVEDRLREDWSPQMIAGRSRKRRIKVSRVSAKAVYKYVYSVYGRQLEKHLHHRRVHKKSGPKRGRQAVMDGRRSIEERPENVQKRRQFGHFEADFIESGKDGRGSLLVLIERKTRYPFLAYVESRKTEDVNRLIARLLRGVPIRSLTLDNDVSFRKHQELSRLIGADVFFCHPYASSEKGTVENRNGRIRERIPKRTNLSTVPPSLIEEIQTKLRFLPMRCLGFDTPQEAWEREMKKAAKRGGAKLTGVLKANQWCSD